MKGTFRKYLKLIWSLYRDPYTPFLAKALLWIALIYAVWPLDLIFDFFPVIGQIDDLVVIFVFILLIIWLIPPQRYDMHYARIFGQPHDG